MADIAAKATAFTATDMAARSSGQATFQAWRTKSYPLDNGKTCYVDRVNEFSLTLPPGWYNSPPSYAANPPAGDNSSVLINVDTRERRGGNGFRPGEIKLTIHKFPFLQDQTLQDWVSGRVAQYRDLQEPPTQVSEPAEYGLGDYQGYLYAISDFSGEAQEIAIEVDGRVVLIGILPSDSPAYDEAIAILKSIKLYDFETCDRPAG